MKTLAAVCYERNAPVVVEEIDLDPPKQGEVLLRVKASGVCHSDLSVVSGVIPHRLPEVLGHEGAGVIEEVGPGVTRFREGDRVMLSFVSSCGTCEYCTRGRPALCATHFAGGRGFMLDDTTRFHKNGVRIHHMSRLGTMAERCVVPESSVVSIDDDIPLDKAALVGCGVTTGVGAVVRTAEIEYGSSVAVIGAGGVGLNVIQGARLCGALKIIAVDRAPSKLEAAKSFGATHAVNASDGDAVDAVRALTGGEGVDYSFEAIGLSATIEQAFHMLRLGGTAVVIGIPRADAMVSLPATLFPFGERRLIGSFFGSAQSRVDMPRILHLYREGRVMLDELVTRTYRLEEVNQAFGDLEAGRNLRGVIVFDDR